MDGHSCNGGKSIVEKSLQLKVKTEEAVNRFNVYGLLSLVFEHEPTPEFFRRFREPEFLRTLKNMGATFVNSFSTVDDDRLTADHGAEFLRLFIGPGTHISPHESVHRTDEEKRGLLWGNSTVEFKQFIEWLGLNYSDDYKGMPDHISIEFDCMKMLIEKELEAWKNKDMKSVTYCLKKEEWLLTEHLVKWIPQFCGLIIENARLPFYSELAILTREWIFLDKQNIESTLEEIS